MPAKRAPSITADIGSLLLAARLKRGLSLEAAAKQTRISKKYLEALETNRFEEFPALVYLRGFLKNYCDYLETDFAPLWRTVSEEMAPKPPPPEPQEPEARPARPKPQPESRPAPPSAGLPMGRPEQDSRPVPSAVAPSQTESPEGRPEPDSASEQDSRPAGTGAILFAALLAGLLVFWLRRPAPSLKESPEPAPASQPATAPAESRMVLVFRRDAWVSVSVDGALKFEGRVPQGQTQEWRPAKFLSLRTPDPRSVRLIVNGNPSPLPDPDAGSGYRIESP